MHNHFLFIGNVLAHWVGFMSSIVSFTLGIVEYLRDKKTEAWIFTIIACLFLIVSFDAAWQDEHRNSSLLIGEKANAVSERDFWKQQSYAKDASLVTRDDLLAQNYTVLAQSQTALSTLSNRLLDITKPSSLKVTSFKSLLQRESDGTAASALVFVVNRTVGVHGEVACSSDFDVVEWEVMEPSHQHAALKSVIHAVPLAPNKVRLNGTLPMWEADSPLIMVITSKDANPDCSFTPQ